jgi:hypothetical protein
MSISKESELIGMKKVSDVVAYTIVVTEKKPIILTDKNGLWN